MKISLLPPALIAFAALVLGILANVFLPGASGIADLSAWLITIAATITLVACIGRSINKRWDGVLVSGRNRMSLSKLQMAAWTILILSALMTATATNIAIGPVTDALNITIGDQLLIVMGIATTSLVAAPAVLSLKDNTLSPNNVGNVASNDAPKDASWLDIFRGDMEGNDNVPDLSKVQQFLISIAVIATYAVLIGDSFASLPIAKACSKQLPCTFHDFPPLSQQVTVLIGISHAGYIAYKASAQPSKLATGTPPTSSGTDDGAVG